MKILLYSGLLKIVSKSGVGEAVRHQKKMLDQLGVSYTTKVTKEFDIIQLNTIFPDSWLMAKWAKWKGKKVIFYAHSTMEDFRNSFRGSNFFAPLFKRWITICYNSSDLIITPTDYSKSLLEGYGLKPSIHVISNGVDTGFFAKDALHRQHFREKYKIKEDQKIIVSVGHYIERKGIMDFIELARQLPDYQFYWFGYTNLHLISKKIRYAIAYTLPNLHFPGYVDRDALKDAYCGGDLFLFLTHEETEGIVILEALAAQIPILVRDIPIYSTWLVDGQTVYKGKTILEFKNKIAQIFSCELPEVASSGLALAKERDLSATSRALLQTYNLLL